GGNWKTYMGKDRQPGPTGEGQENLFQNFVDSIRANDRSILEGDIREGHYSCSLVHLANISYRLGRTLNFDPTTEKCIGDKDANQMLDRAYRSPFVVPNLA
ncbi:MAG: gfo/Idh/MocA family oxidoreductase, partial [Cyclobacteriaceae bacterium]